MIKYYTNRELSAKLNIHLARWKRWSREFLPPDPLGGRQSGYARQYHPNDAFTVFLGGHLVSSLRYTIPEARHIVADLTQWFFDKGYYHDLDEIAAPPEKIEQYVKEHVIWIIKNSDETAAASDFCYTIKGLLADEPGQYHGYPVKHCHYVEMHIPQHKADPAFGTEGIKILNITRLHVFFSNRLALPNNTQAGYASDITT